MVNINNNTIIQRAAAAQIKHYLEPGKVVVLYGPRRVGKTTLLRQITSELAISEKLRFENGEDISIHKSLSSQSIETLTQFVGDTTLLIIDEAQIIPNIGRNLKLLVDSHPSLKIIASGSASFDLAQKVGEPLVGRKWTVMLYPFWIQELISHRQGDSFAVNKSLETLLVYGSYPAVVQTTGYAKKRELLMEIVNSYLYKDILSLETVRKPKIIHDLLESLAWQVGQEVSLNEVGNKLQIDRETVRRYLDVLEQAFILVNIRGFSRNLRKEITKTSRYYFYDTGVRNALIGNFNNLKLRPDVGALWENWLVMERIKKQKYTSLYANNYFWRTYDQKEIDWLEEREGKLFGYEFSWSAKKIKKSTEREFKKAYPDSELSVVHRDNFEDFILPNPNSTPGVYSEPA